jgi:tetratricopeptide (TPR) repeat protein
MRASLRRSSRQWSRAAWGLALIFGSLPVASRLLLGFWGFEGATQIAALCLIAGAYLRLWSWRKGKAIRDSAVMLSEALAFAAQGERDRAIGLLSTAIRMNSSFWQAYQNRGQLYLDRPETWTRALADFDAALRLAPEEAELRGLREQAHNLLLGKIPSQNHPG